MDIGLAMLISVECISREDSSQVLLLMSL